jgi:hypothetical protein
MQLMMMNADEHRTLAKNRLKNDPDFEDSKNSWRCAGESFSKHEVARIDGSWNIAASSSKADGKHQHSV